MDALSLLAHLMFKTFFLALPVGVAWLAFRRLSMSESRNAWLYSAVGLFSSVSAAALAPWALGFSGVSWIVLLTALLCPPLWIATVLICDLRQRPYGDEDATDWVIERFTSRRPIPADNPALEPLVLQTPVAEPEPTVPVFRHTPAEPMAQDTATTFEPDLDSSSVEFHHETATASVAESIEKTEDEELSSPLSLKEPVVDPEIAPVDQSTAVEKNAFRGTEVEAPRQNETRRVLDVARDMRGDGVSKERLMRETTRKPSRNLTAFGGTA